jgi:glycerol-1-phosphate dehydrogenase [NAD(P)+]
MPDIVQHYLETYDDRVDVEAIEIGRDIITECYDVLAEQLGDGPWLVAADPNTWDAAGDQVREMLEQHGQTWHRHEITAQPGHAHPVCSDELIEECRQAIEEHGCTAGLAVGSGTVNDTVKMAAHRAGRPMGVVGTAPSMNGYTSSIAAILSDGVKTSQPCSAPRAIVADVEVMAQAPMRLIQAGLGDLMSKPVSNSDWAISARLNGTPHSDEAMEIIEEGAAALEGVAPKVPERDRRAVRGLVDSLILSGIAMSVAGSSSPASGGEHLISHYIDMTAHAFDQPYDLHGCQVGVGTLTSAFLYEKLRAFDPSTLDIDARVAALPDWSSYEETLEERFGALHEAVVGYAEPAYPSPQRLRSRLEQMVQQWNAMLEEASQTLRTRQSLEDELRSVGAPTRFQDLGISKDRAHRAIVHGKDIRNRYTVLHLCWELGTLEEWGAEAIELLYD